MYIFSAIDSNFKDAPLSGDTYEEGFVGATDSDHAGIDSRQEYYFYYNKDYEVVKNKLISIEKLHEGERNTTTASLVLDQVMESTKHKYLFMLREPLGHFLLNNLLLIFSQFEKDKDSIFVIFTGAQDHTEQDSFATSERGKLLTYMSELLVRHGVIHYFLKSNLCSINYNNKNNASKIYAHLGVDRTSDKVVNCLVYKAKNFTIVDTVASTHKMTLKDVKYCVDNYICDIYSSNEDSHRKLYLSRGVYDSEPEPFKVKDDGSVFYKSASVRMYEEHLLEKYFESIGFEIFRPDKMRSIEEQIRTAFSASVIVGSSGTGLVNSLFMEDNKIIVEIRSELGGDFRPHWLADDYWAFSAARNHLYVAVDLPDKQATTAIKKFKELFNSLDLDRLIVEKKLNSQDLH